MRFKRYVLLIAGASLFAACNDPLNVENTNDPDRDRVLATPADLEQFIVNTWNAYHDAVLGGSSNSLYPQMLVAALENFAELANFGMNVRYQIPRSFIDNQRGNPIEGGNLRDFVSLSSAARGAALGLGQLDVPGFSLGSVGADARARALARFVLGVSLGTLAMTYDSAAVAAPDDDPELIPPLQGYAQVIAIALDHLDQAQALAEGNAGAFPMPATWLNTAGSTSQEDFVRIVRSYRALLRAGVARDPAERAAVDWGAVIADAEAGLVQDFELEMAPALGWDIVWFPNHFRQGGWHRMHGFMIGFADTSGAFDTWLATPRANRVQFVVQTPDTRFPVGATRDAQQVVDGNGDVIPNPVLPDGQYFLNRPPGDDILGDPLGNSMYDHYRFRAFFNADRNGPFPVLTKAQVDLLAAEGYIRQGDFAMAEGKINITRMAAGLPEITGTTGLGDLVPGGTACVPRVPQPPSFNSTDCGNIMEAMKYEKRIETAYTSYGAWFFDSRGWGDIPEGTAIHWPVPWQEMDARVQTFYSLGGCNAAQSAGPSTYGLSCSL